MAGLFDGEGCVSIVRQRRIWKGAVHEQLHLRCFIVNTDLALIRLLKKKFGGSVHISDRSKNGWKNSGQWKLSSDQAYEFLKWVLPSCFVKSKQIALALDFHEFRKLPMSRRCILIPKPLPNSPNLKVWKKTDVTIAKEEDFKVRLHTLNKKGT